MPQVIFYLLSSDTMTADFFACRLADKAWREGFNIHIQTDDSIASKYLDDMLWSWREDSFMPHAILSESYDSEKAIPVTIGHGEEPMRQAQPLEMLINIAKKPPSFYNQFQRVCEIVTPDSKSTELSRKKFRFYQQAGIKPSTHRL